jgi:hypothetical protein
MVTAAGGKGTLHKHRHLVHFRHAATEAAVPTLSSRMRHGARIGAPLGAVVSLVFTWFVAGGLVDPGEVFLGLFGGVVGGGYLGAFIGLVNAPDE